MRLGNRTWWIALGVVIVLAAVIPLVAHGYLGSFDRYIADDFCTASSLRRLGFLGSQAYWFQSWSGRYSYTFVVSLTQAVGSNLTPLLPSLALVAWVAAIVFAARHLLGSSSPWLIALAIAAVHAFTTLEGAPSVYQSLYWQTGMITYTLPLVLAVAYGTWLWCAAVGKGGPGNRAAAGAISFGAAFLLGGFSETYVVLQTVVLTVLLVSLPISLPAASRSRAASLLVAGWAGSVLSALTMAFAPGTQVRRELMPAAPDLGVWIEATVRDGYLFLARTVKGAPQAILLAIAVPLFLVMGRTGSNEAGAAGERHTSRGNLLVLLLLPVLIPLLILATIAPYEFAVSSYPDSRVLITAMFVLVTGLVLWGAALGVLLSRRVVPRPAGGRPLVILLSAVVVLGLVLSGLRSASTTLGETAVARDYARSWEIRDEKLKLAGQSGAELVAAASLRHMGGLAEIGRDPEEWINRCVAGTYGVGSVVAK